MSSFFLRVVSLCFLVVLTTATDVFGNTDPVKGKPICPDILELSAVDDGTVLTVTADAEVKPELVDLRISILGDDGTILLDTIGNATLSFQLPTYSGVGVAVEANLICSFKGEEFESNSISTEILSIYSRSSPDFCYTSIACAQGAGIGGHGFTTTSIKDFSYEFSPGDTVFINSLPVLLFEVDATPLPPNVDGNPFTYSGVGIVALPFGQASVWVDFGDIRIDVASRVITSGSVIPQVEGTGLSLPNGQGGTPLTCIEPPVEGDNSAGFFDVDGVWQPAGTVYNDQGFDVNGNYVKPPYDTSNPPQPYDPTRDPNGFDANGNHINGSQYDENGCSQAGIDINEEPCAQAGNGNPYYWITGNGGSSGSSGGGGNPPLPGGTKLVEENLPDILSCIRNAVDALKTEYTAKVESLEDECQGLRDKVIQNVSEAGVPIELVSGNGGKYTDAGMSNEFTGRPEVETPSIQRDANILALEESHVNLYDCDEALQDYVALKKFVEFVELTEPSIVQGDAPLRAGEGTDIENYITAYLASFSQVMINNNEWNDPTRLCEEITKKVREYVEDKVENGVSFNLPTRSYLDNKTFKITPPDFTSSLASNGSAIYKNRTNDFDLIAYEWAQGWQTVGGIDRGLFVREVARVNASSTTSSCQAQKMPLQVTKSIGPISYDIFIDNLVLTPHSPSAVVPAKADVYYIYDDFASIPAVIFKALNESFDQFGFSNGSVRLAFELGEAAPIPIERVGALHLLQGQTFVDVSCQGFEGVNIGADLEFCRNAILPIENGQVLPEPATVKVSFNAYFPSWEELIVSIDIPPFAPAAKPDVIITAETMFLDRSSISSPTIVFPQGYNNPLAAGNRNLWTGFYCSSFSVQFPMSLGENSGPTTITAENLIIDKTGVSVNVSYEPSEPIIPLESGSIGGWGASVERLSLSILHNRFDGLGMGGRLHVPMVRATPDNLSQAPKPEDCLAYDAAYSSANGLMATTYVEQPMYADILSADVTFERGSFIEIKTNSSFENVKVKAELTGSLNGGANGNQNPLNPGKVTFQKFVFGTPLDDGGVIHSIGTWGFEDSLEVNLGPHGLFLENVEIGPGENDEVLVSFKGGVRVFSDITASGDFNVVTGFKSYGNGLDVKFKRVVCDGLGLQGNMWGTEVDMLLRWIGDEEHPLYDTWGKAFWGRGSAKFKKISLAAAAQFGSKTNSEGELQKYFFVDLLASQLNIPVFGNLVLDGIGGGLSKGVSQNQDNTQVFATADPKKDSGSESDFGTSISGTSYSVDEEAGLSASLALVVTSSPNPNLVSIYNKLKFNFGNGTGQSAKRGLESITLDGYLKMMDEPFKVPIPIPAGLTLPDQLGGGEPPVLAGQAKLTANWFARLSLGQQTTLHATLDSYLDAGVIKGIGPKNELVRGEAHFEPGLWYVKMGGAPIEQRAGTKMTLDLPGGSLQATSSAYFQAGHGVDPIPPLPPKIRQFFGSDNLVGIPTRGDGLGIAFGSHFDFAAMFEAGVFYADINVLAGFDFNLRKYDGVSCANTNADIGINGWYAQGQLYGYVSGEAGVKIGSKRHSALNLDAGILFQAALPNPTYAKGIFKGQLQVLGVGGSAQISLELGSQCEFEFDPSVIANGPDPEFDYLLNAELPTESNLELSQPFVFNLRFPVNHSVNFSETQVVNGTPQSVEKTYDISYQSPTSDIYIISESGIRTQLSPAVAKIAVNEDDSRQLVVIPDQWWPANSTVEVILNFNTKEQGAVVHEQEYVFNYHTGDYPDFIPSSNVKYSYPLPAQEEYLPRQLSYDYIGLKLSQQYLFQNPATTVHAVYTDLDGVIAYSTSNVSYNTDLDEIRISKSEFHESSESAYQLFLISEKDEISNHSIQSGSGLNSVAYAETIGYNVPAQPSESMSEGSVLNLNNPNYTAMFSVVYSTSLYGSFAEKIEALDLTASATISDVEQGFRLKSSAVKFGRYETAVEGTLVNSSSLVSMKLNLDSPSSPGSLWRDNLEEFSSQFLCAEEVTLECTNGARTLDEVVINPQLSSDIKYDDDEEILEIIFTTLNPTLPPVVTSSGNTVSVMSFAYGDGAALSETSLPPLSENPMLHYEIPSQMLTLRDNTFEYFTRLEKDVVDRLVQAKCFDDLASDITDAREVRQVNLIEFRDAFPCIYTGTGLRNGLQSREADPSFYDVSFNKYYGSTQFNTDLNLSLKFSYRFPGDSSERPDYVLDKSFNVERL